MISKITDSMFQTTSMLKKGLDAAWLRQEVAANNMANADVPNFKASKVTFESLLSEAMESGFKGRQTRAGHIQIGAADVSDISPQVVIDSASTSMRMDGNNVDVEKENVEMLQAQFYYSAVMAKVNGELSRLRTAITGG